GKEILVLTPPTDEVQALCLAANGFTASVPDLWTARLLSRTCEKYSLAVRVHLQVNTGMNRYGMNSSMLGKVCKFLSKAGRVSVEGLYSHLYDHSRAECEKQRAVFMKMKAVCERYFPDVLCHLSSTYGALLGDDFAFGMVRVGLGLYGYLPEGIEEELKEKLRLRKAMKVYARAVENRKYSFGGAGYGVLSEAQKKEFTYLTVYRAGYADGFSRHRDNGMRGGEKNANNLCMDVCIRKGRGVRGSLVPVMTDAEETAKKTGTISYEILCAATKRAEFEYDYR
ncbi:MAG: alanine racemase, partial [Coriobacteriales bacterium]